MKDRNFQLVIVGVGGQGILTVSDVLGSAAISQDLNPVMSEVHGMAQRGGVVVSEMKLGGFLAPLVATGGADAILSFEPLEAYRALPKLKKGGFVVTNSEPLIPPNVSIGQATYPEPELIFAKMREAGLNLITVPALELAKEAGNERTGNIAMLGALSAIHSFVLPKEELIAAIKNKVPEKLVDVNVRAFNLGVENAMAQIKA